MSTTSIEIPAPSEEVWSVLADPTLFSEWVVGAKHIRDADAWWPAPGSKFHHTVGVGPLTINDSTKSVEVQPGRRLVMDGRARPAGRARIDISLEPTANGTRVEMVETVSSPRLAKLWEPAFEPVITYRNRVALRRLRDLVLGRVRGHA